MRITCNLESMIRRLTKFIIAALLLAGYPLASPAQDSIWTFEGLITKADSRLAPDLQSGWVLSGSFIFTPLNMEEEIPPGGSQAGRFSGGVTGAELTVDLYHQLHFEALQVPGMAGFDYKDNDPEEDGRDLYGWFFPMQGQLKESQWSSSWLQIWLSDSKGNMIQTVPPLISPYGIEAESAWFRLTLKNEEGEKVFVDGSIEYFGPLDGRPEDGLDEDWAGVAAELSRELVKRDEIIASLREELVQSKARIDSLRTMVDLMVEERNTIEDENRLLSAKILSSDTGAESAISSLEADKALLQDELETLNSRNEALTESLAESEYQRRNLIRELEEIKQALPVADEEADTSPEPVSVKNQEGREIGTMTVAQAPEDPRQPIILNMPLARPVENAVVSPKENLSPPPAPKAAGKKRRASPKGPRKFR